MTAGLVLAAGESSRMGRDKALLFYRGRTFLETVIATLHEAGIHRVAVVLGHHAQAIQQAVNLAGVEVVTNCDYLCGQTSSLQAGLAALVGSPAEAETLDAIVLCLVDHPAFAPATVSALLDAFVRSQAPVIIPTYGGRRGHPVLIARSLFEPLRALRPNQGANTAIRAWRHQTELLEVADPGVLVDVDDPEAYRQLSQLD
ncbi:MAG TPA: nucleotidyltransferase family protein [Terriglobia bacterium]